MSKVLQETEINLFAFWGYDLFPYMLGAVVTKMAVDGSVYAPSYQGWFSPLMLLPISTGKELAETLKEIRAQQDAAIAAELKKWDSELLKLVPTPLKKAVPKR